MTAAPSFTCPVCGATSWNPNDVREGYCGRCHDWTGQPHLDAARAVEHGVVVEMPNGQRVGCRSWPAEPGLPRVGDDVVDGGGFRARVKAVEWQLEGSPRDGWSAVGTVIVLEAVARR